MKRYREFREECIILEHPNLKARIIAKINPMDKIRDKIDDLKKLPGKLKDKAVDKLKDKIDDLNPMSPINKKVTMMRQNKIGNLKDKRTGLKTKIKSISTKIDSLKAKVKK
jgi:uncharacterized coiled-coil DUF342 family protein